mmetsp:Transcript_22274/g.28102  ORF Transcript_22274/g.28102 Transcript_22274/m.28102 type:complete len:150 (+) Transcript_22274:74-523(+)
MGCACCKPEWQGKSDDFKVAYIYEECACFRPRTFVLRGKDDEWEASIAKSIVEDEVFDKSGLILKLVEGVPKGCCGFEEFEHTVTQFNEDCAPSINTKIAQYGFEVDGFNWVEYRYVSHGNGGGSVQPVPHFCIRIKKISPDDDVFVTN